MKKILMILSVLVVLVVIMIVVTNRLENGHKTVADATVTIPTTEQVQVAAAATVPAQLTTAPVAEQAQVATVVPDTTITHTIEVSTNNDPHLSTLPSKYWSLKPQIERYYDVYKANAAAAMMAGSMGIGSFSDDSEEPLGDFEARVRKEREEYAAQESTRKAAQEIIDTAWARLEKDIEQALAPEPGSVAEFKAWDVTNRMARLSAQDLARLKTDAKMPPQLWGYGYRWIPPITAEER